MPSPDFGQEFVRIIEIRRSEGCSEEQIVAVLQSHGITMSLERNKLTIAEAEWQKLVNLSDVVLRHLNSIQPQSVGQYPASQFSVAEEPIDAQLLELKRLAEQGDAAAQFSLGIRYGKPDSETTDHVEAVKWYSMAAEGGHPEAHGKLGYRYSVGGFGLPKDGSEAVRWYKRGAELGDAYSQHILAAMYCDGDEVEKNHAEAIRLFRMAANQGFVHSLRCLGVMHYTGDGIPKNHTEALRLFTKAADQGDAESQHNLSIMYAGGEGTKRNPTEAARWQRKAIEQGYVPVQSDRDDELVSVRDRNGGFVGKFPLKELRAKAVAGSIDLESEMMWASGGPWILLNDLIPSGAERHRAEIRLRQNPPQEVLVVASKTGDYELLKWLLADEPDILKQGNEALIIAIQKGHAACVRLLVTRGANLADAKIIDAACERGDATINRYLNPTNDKELAALFESASQGTRVVKQGAARLAEINRERAALENQLKHLPKTGKDGIHIPKCPTCGSPDVERIALASKGLAAFAFGLFSIGYAGKTYECHNCRHKW